jgi:MYND finger.
MKDAVFIFFVIVILLGLTAFRYRRQIVAARRIWQMLKGNGLAGGFPVEQVREQNTNTATPLVKCSRCGTWTPLDRSIRLSNNIYYCSTNCLENKVAAKLK